MNTELPDFDIDVQPLGEKEDNLTVISDIIGRHLEDIDIDMHDIDMQPLGEKVTAISDIFGRRLENIEDFTDEISTHPTFPEEQGQVHFPGINEAAKNLFRSLGGLKSLTNFMPSDFK